MRGRVGGVVLTGPASWTLEPVGLPRDLALAPFGGSHRFIDFSLAALENAGIAGIRVVPGSADAPRDAYGAALQGREPGRFTLLTPPPVPPTSGRLARTLAACAAACERGPRPTLLVALPADRVLQVDLRALLQAHEAARADLTLVGVAAPPADVVRGPFLVAKPDGTLEASSPPSTDGAPAVTWTGALIVRVDGLPSLLESADRDDVLLENARRRLRVLALDALAAPGDPTPPYFHAPASLEAYYEAQMELCAAPSGPDPFDARWPVRTAPKPLPAARVMIDEAGRPGQALSVLMAEGSVIRGGAAIRSVLGHSVVVEAGAEVEDSLLFDGCRIGRGACVRRAIVGPGAIVEEGQHIGYGDEPAAAIPLPSGLVLLPPTSPHARRAAAAR